MPLSPASSSSSPRAVILLSGGLDSATTLAIANDQGFACWCLSFHYGQRHSQELAAAENVARALGAAHHHVITLDPSAFTGSALTGDIEVPKDRDQTSMASGIPPTYVPARNLVFLSFAAAYAETIDARDLFIGANAIDYSGYPDCRPAFIDSFQRTANLATKAGVEGHGLTVHAPLIDLTKAQIIQLGESLGVEYSLTHSCYEPDETGAACGRCDACSLRKRGFEQANIPDPTRYTQAAPA